MKNKIKIILFAGLIAAMILPFSGMMMAEAVPNEKASDKAKGEDSLKKRVADAKVKFNDKLTKAEKEETKKEHKEKIKRVLYRLDLVYAIISLPNWDNVNEMTPEDLETRTTLAILLHQSGEDEAKLRATVSITDDAPIITTSHSQGSWDIAYHTTVSGSVNCGAAGVKYWNGDSDGLVEVYSSGSTFYNDWDYDTEIWKNPTQGCANPPNDHYSNILKVVDLFGSASDCYVGTSNPTGTTSKYCSGFTEWDIVPIYTRGTYDNNVYMESSSWGLGTILGL